MKTRLLIIISLALISLNVSNILAVCDPDIIKPGELCLDGASTLIIESHESQIENIDGQLFHVIGPFTLEQESDDRIRFDGVIFTYPSYPNPPTPGGPVSITLTFENGAIERIFKIGAPSPFIEFVGVDPQAGVRRNANGLFDYLLSFEQYPGSTLKQQLVNNIHRNEIECPSENQVLVLRPNEKLACVYFETADKLQWTTLEPVNGTYEIIKNNEIFFVDYFIPEGKIIDMSYDEYANSIIVNLKVDVKKSIFYIHIPRALVDASQTYCDTIMGDNSRGGVFMVLHNGEEIAHSLFDNTNNKNTLIIPLIQNYNNLEFIGTCYA